MPQSNVKTGADEPRPGRPRDPELNESILQATLSLLTEHGYAGTSIEKVASYAGVGKTSIYRRYASKAELVVAAVGSLRGQKVPLPDSGSGRSDAIEWINRTRRPFERNFGLTLIGALLVEERRNPQLINLLRERVIWPQRAELITLLQRSRQRGEIRADCDLEEAAHALVGAVIWRRLLGFTTTREQVEAIVGTIWDGLEQSPQP